MLAPSELKIVEDVCMKHLESLALERVFAGKDVSGIKEAKEVIRNAIRSMIPKEPRRPPVNEAR